MSAYWTLDETVAPNYVDKIGSHTLTCNSGCPVSLPGLYNGGQDFSSLSSDLQISTAAALDWPVDSDFSVEYWFKRDLVGFSAAEAFLSRAYAADSALGLWVGLGIDGKVRVELADSAGNGPLTPLVGSSVVADGNWHQVVFIRDAGNARNRIYVDGRLEQEQTYSYSAALGLSADTIAIGWNAAAAADFYGGELDELALYQRILSPFEISQHYTDGSIGLKFAYCGSPNTIRVMPVGDSVTAGYNSINWDTDYMVGYRQKLYLDLNALGYQVDFVGSGSSGQLNPPAFDYDHEGHGGWSDSMISGNVYSWLQANPTDIVLVHAGTNFVSPDPVSIERILDEIDRYSKDVVVVLAKIINKKVPDPDFSLFNQNVEAMANSRILAGDKIILVDQEHALVYPDDLDDDLHPTQVGYEKMADVWRSALEQILPVPAFASPVISSSPALQAFLNFPYIYQLVSSGMPPPVYKLIDAPSGMSIGEISGRLEWAAGLTGSFPVTIEARNALGTFRQDFILAVTDSLILDTGDPGTSSTGFWAESSGLNYYGNLSLWSRDVGSDYTFLANLADTWEVSLWWTEWSSRCASVPVEIYDGDLLLDRLQVNQQLTGGQWNSLGIYSFSGAARIRILSESSECSTNADAVRFVPAAKPALDFIQIEGPATVNKNSTATYLARAFYADGSSQAIVVDNWSDNSVSAEISVSGILTTFDVNSDQPCHLTASYSENGISRSASFDLTILNSSVLIIDTGDPGTSWVGTWSESSGPFPYDSPSLWSRDLGAHYDYQASLTDTYEVSLWWTEWSSRCTAVPVDIYDGDQLLRRVFINQQVDGGRWNILGTYSFAGVARVSIQTEDADCSTNADAVQFAPGVKAALDRIEIEGPLSVNKNATASYIARVYYVDGSNQPVTPDSWSDDSAFANIAASGLLTTLEVSTDQPCRLSASYTENGITRLATFDLIIVNSAIQILDTGDPGTSFVGTWSDSSGPTPYGSLSLWSREAGASYSYQTGLVGDYETSLWWTEWSSRCTVVPVEIYDGVQLLDRVLINQQANGGQWNSLGVYSFSGTARVVILSEDTGCSTNADAVQFAPGIKAALDHVQIEGPLSVYKNSTATYVARAFYVDGSSRLVGADNWSDDSVYADISSTGTLTTLDVATDQPCRLSISYSENTITRNATFDLTISSSDILILDTGDPGTSSVGLWQESSGAASYGALSLWNRELGASYSFESSVIGNYQIDLWWTEYISRCTAVRIDVYDGDQLLNSVTVNQQVNGGQWNSLGTYTFSGTARGVIRSESTACSTNADALRLMPAL